DAIRVEATVVDDGAHRDGQRMGGADLEEAVYTGWPHREVRAVGGEQINMAGQRMLWRHHAVLEVPMAEKVGVPVGIIPPRCRGVRVEPLVLASKDALGSAVTGGASR